MTQKVSTRFLLYFIFLVLIPFGCIWVFNTSTYVGRLSADATRERERAVTVAAEALDSELRSLSIQAARMLGKKTFITEARNFRDAGSGAQRLEAMNALLSLVDELGGGQSPLEGGGIYSGDRLLLSIRNYDTEAAPEVTGSGWFAEARKIPGKVFLPNTLMGYSVNHLNAAYFNICFFASDDIAVHLTFKSAYLTNLAQSTRDAGEGALFVVDSGGATLFVPPWDVGERQGVKSPLRAGEADFTATVGKTGWLVVRSFERGRGDETQIGFMRLQGLFLAAFVAVIAAFVILFFRNTIKPLGEIERGMETAQTGNLSVRIPVSAQDEIGRLAQSFNEMLERLQDLAEQNEKAVKERVFYEVDALQSQINPHFVANTINSVRLMALRAGDAGIEAMARDLVKYFSFIYQWKSNYVSLGTDMDMLEVYVRIMKVRYGDRFRVDVEMEPGLEVVWLLKMALQPLVENAIIHGATQTDEPGRIVLRCLRDRDTLVVSVRDNGPGPAPAEPGEDADGDPQLSPSIGLVNVRRRIALNHGEGYGVELTRGNDGWTEAKLTLPLLDKEPAAYA